MKRFLSLILALGLGLSAMAQSVVSVDARQPIRLGQRTVVPQVDFGQQQVNLISLRVKAPQGGTLVVRDLTTPMPTHWGRRPIPAEMLEEMRANWGIVARIDVPFSHDYRVITLPINRHPSGIIDLQVASADDREVNVDWLGFDMKPELHPALLSDEPLQPWSQGGLTTHRYRNLLAELGYTQQQIDAKFDELVYELFEGPDRIYFELPGQMGIVSDVKNHDARTEGMSYGMMIAVQLGKKDVFDRLYRWAKTYMQMTDGPQKGYFAWSVKPDGTGAARGAAADGELYFITSLLFASNLWGNDTGINYKAEAQAILNTILGKDGQLRLIDPVTHLIAFVPGANYTDPSYHLPAFYEVWARYADDGRSDYWMECARLSRQYLHKSIHPVTGLNPDYNNFDGSLMHSGRTLGDAFRYDSWRVPMNIALDFSWSNADAEWQTQYGHRLQDFLYSQGIDNFVDQYNVDGTTVTDTLAAGGFKELRHTPGFIATSAALSLVCSHSKAREFVDRFWNNRHDPTPSGYKDAYYEGILRLFAFLHLSGRYRVIEPVQSAASPAAIAAGDDGSQLWLRQQAVGQPSVTLQGQPSATTRIAQDELQRGWQSAMPVVLQVQSQRQRKADSFTIRSQADGSIVVCSPSDVGLLYGTYHLLRLQAMGADLHTLAVDETPFHDIRVLDHWDNLDGNSERGYAGRSIFWNVDGYPQHIGQNHVAEIANNPLNNPMYARANASLGINGVVLNNVNASPKMLTAEVIDMVRQYADVLRPYGIRVYLAVNFSSPVVLDGLPTADPLDRGVQRWWQQKVRQIYAAIPDFGGFLVKANSEGQPGPMDFGRTHAEGANVLARALRPYGGIVMWRAFVYSPTDPDRAKQARLEFEHLDGQFLDNVIIQIKNGPIDFQPREPYNALFGGLHRTSDMVEFQVTQEYLGQSNHLAYLGTMWQEFFTEVNTYADYLNYQQHSRHNAISGVANIGTDADWTGHPLAQSNWYAYGRMAWNPQLTAQQIAGEWVAQTFAQLDATQRQTLVGMLMRSREAVVDYEMPLGLHHQFGDSHYAPGPWENRGIRRDWLPAFYNQADSLGIGSDRTTATGSQNTAQYAPAFAQQVEDVSTCPDRYLLWFHHVPWDHRCQSGRTVWHELCLRYQHGLDEARQMQRAWNSLQPVIDPAIFHDVQLRLMTQVRDAEWWKDGCLLYFQSLHHLPFPDELEPPVHTLQECQNARLRVGLYRSPSHDELNRVR